MNDQNSQLQCTNCDDLFSRYPHMPVGTICTVCLERFHYDTIREWRYHMVAEGVSFKTINLLTEKYIKLEFKYS